LECKLNHNILTDSKSQVDFDCLSQLHVLDRNKEKIGWGCSKVVKCCSEKREDNCTDHKCLGEWNDIDKSKSLVNFLHKASVILQL
jgi:hypothetical protein